MFLYSPAEQKTGLVEAEGVLESLDVGEGLRGGDAGVDHGVVEGGLNRAEIRNVIGVWIPASMTRDLFSMKGDGEKLVTNF